MGSDISASDYGSMTIGQFNKQNKTANNASAFDSQNMAFVIVSISQLIAFGIKIEIGVNLPLGILVLLHPQIQTGKIEVGALVLGVGSQVLAEQPDVAVDVGDRMSRWFRVALIDIFEKLVVERAHGLWDGFGLNPEHHAYFA